MIKIKTEVGQHKSHLYTLETAPSVFKNVWGSVVLDQRMALVDVGQKVRITFKGLGEATGGNNAPKLFKVEVDRE